MAYHGTKLGTLRTYWLAIIIFIAAFLNGYDSGVAGGILAFKSFQHDSDKIGRRKAIAISAVIFLIGTILQTVDTHSLSAWYVARVVAGFGQGGCTLVVPTYSAEMAPKEIRARLGSFYQWMYTLGIFISYWINYVCE